MRFLVQLRHACKLTNLTYPSKNSLSYASVAGNENQTHISRYGSKPTGELKNEDTLQEAFALLSLLRDYNRQVKLIPHTCNKFQIQEKQETTNDETSFLTDLKDQKNLCIEGKTNLQEKYIPALNVTSDSPTLASYSLPKKLEYDCENFGLDLEPKAEVKNLKEGNEPSVKTGLLRETQLSTSVDSDISLLGQNTIPLHLNTLINGTACFDKFQSVKDNEFLTALSSNLCNAALQKGFQTESQKFYSTERISDAEIIEKLMKKYDKVEKDDKKSLAKNSSTDELVKDILDGYDKFLKELNTKTIVNTGNVPEKSKVSSETKRDPHIVCVREGTKGCISPGLADNPPFIPKKTPEAKETLATKEISRGFSLLDSKLYQKSLKEAEAKRKRITEASSPCKGNDSPLKTDSSHACQKSEIKDPCKSISEKPIATCEDKISSDVKPSSLKKGSQVCGSKKDDQKVTPTSEPCKKSATNFSQSNSQNHEKTQTKSSRQISSTDEFELEPKEHSPNTSSKDLSDDSKASPITLKKPLNLTNCDKSPASESKLSSESKSESKPGEKLSSSSKCDSASKTTVLAEQDAKDRCKKLTLGSKTKKHDPKASDKTSSSSKCQITSEPKVESKKEDIKDPCKTIKSKSEPKCEQRTEEKPSLTPKCSSTYESKAEKRDHCKTPTPSKASKCNSKSDSAKTESNELCKKSSKSSCSSKVSQKELPKGDSLKACKRAAKTKCSSNKDNSPCESDTKNLCKSSCDAMPKPKPKCGQPPRGNTKPKCKKDSPCASKEASPCASTAAETPCKKSPSAAKCSQKTEPLAEASKEKSSDSKCGQKTEETSPISKCGAKSCAPSPRPSKTDLKQSPKSGTTSTDTKSKDVSTSKPPKKGFHTFARTNSLNLVFTRKFSDDCPEKPKGGYKPETKRSDEYRRETCENFSWKSNRPRNKQTEKTKNCYPNETQEFCPDTACYRVYSESSGKSNKKKGKKNKKPKVNNLESNTKSSNFPLLKLKSFLFKQNCRFFSKMRDNQEALIEKPYKICIREHSDLEVLENDALIAVDSVVLSDTDIYMFETGGKHTPGLTLGSEAAGVVQKVGENVTELRAGDHVVIESSIPCGICELCKSGRYNLCDQLNIKGCLRKCCVHPASFCHKINKEVPMVQAALVHQLALGCNACQKADMKPNSNIVIIGSCAMSVCTAISALCMGTENICIMCGMPEAKVIIEQFVTEKVNCFDSRTTDKGILRMILASLGTFPDIVINCACSTKTMNAAIMALRPAGTCIISGFLTDCVCFDIICALTKEIKIIPCFRSNNMFPLAIHLLESGRTPIQCLMASCSKWNKLECAFKRALSEGNNGPRKAIVKCQIDD